MNDPEQPATKEANETSANACLTLLLLLTLTACSQPPRQVRVMTYNIHHGADAGGRPSLDDPIRLLVESVEAHLVADVDRDEKKARKADRQPHNVQARVEAVLTHAAQRDADVISDHLYS